MLVKFSVKNFRNFKDTIELDLSKPRDYTFNTHVIKDGVIKNGILYGPNGCGKTNFGLAIFDIVNHLTQKWKKQDYYTNFMHIGSKNGDIEFQYFFNFNGMEVNYNYIKNPAGLLSAEKLTLNNNLIFMRTKNSFELDKEFPMNETLKKNFNGSVNNVSIINFLISTYPLEENHYLLQLQNFVNSMLWFKCLEKREFIGLDTDSSLLDEYFIKNDLVVDFQYFLNEVSEQEFIFNEEKSNENIIYCVINNVPIPFNTIASTGTKSLQLLYYWINRMQDASFVFIDEFDAFYHFKLAFEVCKRLFNLNCQVFTSSHNTYLMTNELLRPDCNFIIDSNSIKSLCDCTEKELRFGHNIEKLFRADTFSL